MLIPQFSLRTTLIAITSCAVYFLFLGLAVRGHSWAIVVSVGVGSLIVILLFHAAIYLGASALARLLGSQQSPARTSRGGVQSNPDTQAPPTLD